MKGGRFFIVSNFEFIRLYILWCKVIGKRDRKIENIRNPDEMIEICETYFPKIYRFISYRINNRDEAEDLASEVFLRLVRSKDVIIGNTQAWLYRVAKNIITDHYRRSSIQRSLIERSEELNEYSDPKSDASARIKVYDIERSLKHLTEEQYQVIILKFIEGYSTREVASIMEKTEGAVKGLQFRALQTMNDFFREDS